MTDGLAFKDHLNGEGENIRGRPNLTFHLREKKKDKTETSELTKILFD